MPTPDEIEDWRISGRAMGQERELELLRKIEALVTDRAELHGVLASVLGQLEEGFHICERCKHQEDTRNMDVVYELRAALNYHKIKKPQ